MQNQVDNTIRGRAGRAVGDLVMAELFLIQATIESASVLGDSLTGLREHLNQDLTENQPRQEFREFLRQTGEQLVEPYSVRFKYLRDIVLEDLSA